MGMGGHGMGTQCRALLHTMLEGPTDRVYAGCVDVKFTRIRTSHRMDHVFMVAWIVFNNHLSEVGVTENHWEDHGHSERSQPLTYSILSHARTRLNTNSLQ